METIRGKTLEYWKQNAEEDYMTTPISVLKYITILEEANQALRQPAVSCWVAFDWNKIETRPTAYGKYLICRKDGKIHWETWNGIGWAYNHNEIRYWAVIVPPCPVWYKSDIEKYMDEYAKSIKKDLADKDKSLLQEFYTIGKTGQIRDKVITGSYAIGSNGMKEPIDWKRYAERLEEYIINIMIKERKI